MIPRGAVAAAQQRGADLTAAVVAGFRAGRMVAAVAESAGISDRQPHRRCLRAFGYRPKTPARVLRLQRTLGPAHRGTPFAEVAAAAGHADQVRLAREAKALAGAPLGGLIR